MRMHPSAVEVIRDPHGGSNKSLVATRMLDNRQTYDPEDALSSSSLLLSPPFNSLFIPTTLHSLFVQSFHVLGRGGVPRDEGNLVFLSC